MIKSLMFGLLVLCVNAEPASAQKILSADQQIAVINCNGVVPCIKTVSADLQSALDLNVCASAARQKFVGILTGSLNGCVEVAKRRGLSPKQREVLADVCGPVLRQEPTAQTQACYKLLLPVIGPREKDVAASAPVHKPTQQKQTPEIKQAKR